MVLELIELCYVVFGYSQCIRKNYEKFTGKTLYWRLFFDKVIGWSLWKEDLAKVFFYEFFVVFKNIDIVEHLRTAASKVQKDF